MECKHATPLINYNIYNNNDDDDEEEEEDNDDDLKN